MKTLTHPITTNLLNRFLSYVTVWTTSDPDIADKGIQPSTESQKDFAEILKKELLEIGITDIKLTEHGYLCARIPATQNKTEAPSICLLAHMDTSSEVSGQNVKPKILNNYDGSVIKINETFLLSPEKNPELKNCIGDTIITTDGNTLLGADDKAGIAEIITAIETIHKNGIEHGPLEIIFSPDEETGHGMDNVPIEWIKSKQCYTVDGGEAGEIEAECFNAYRAIVSFTGKSMHTGSARPEMTNAITMASAFLNILPRNESPETTDGYQGFFAPIGISGQIESSEVSILLRDFETKGMQRRIKLIEQTAETIRQLFPNGFVSVKLEQQYLNMKDKIKDSPKVTDLLVKAVNKAGTDFNKKAVFMPIRGGTDGSRLTELGLPTPNIFTGGHNFHSRLEWASLSQMLFSTLTIMELISLWSEEKNS